MLGCLNKMLAKVLVVRLGFVMDMIVCKNYSAFIKGKHLVDGVVVANEVVDHAKRTGNECMIFKVDFEKTYDSANWGFLDYMLQKFGFYKQ